MAVVDTAGYFSTATWIQNARNGGGTYDPEGWGYPWRIVLHTIEGSANPGTISGHPYPPQIWYRPASRQLFQTVPLSRSGFALYQAPSGLHYTNKARAIQVEIEGFAAETGTWPQEWLDNITADVIIPICQWVASVGASIDLNQHPAPGPDANSASEFAPQRMPESLWGIFNGLCSHRHIPTNDHWDTGQLDTPRIAQHAAMVIGGLITDTPGRTTITEDDDMAIIAMLNEPTDPQHGSLWAVNGLFKRRISTMEEYEEMLRSGQAKKQADGSGWVVWNMGQLRPYATIDEWSLAGIPDTVTHAVAGALGNVGGQVAAQVAAQIAPAVANVGVQIGPVVAQAMQQSLAGQGAAVSQAVAATIEHQLADLPQRLATAIKSAFSNPLPPLRDPLREPVPPAPPSPPEPSN